MNTFVLCVRKRSFLDSLNLIVYRRVRNYAKNGNIEQTGPV